MLGVLFSVAHTLRTYLPHSSFQSSLTKAASRNKSSRQIFHLVSIFSLTKFKSNFEFAFDEQFVYIFMIIFSKVVLIRKKETLGRIIKVSSSSTKNEKDMEKRFAERERKIGMCLSVQLCLINVIFISFSLKKLLMNYRSRINAKRPFLDLAIVILSNRCT
jgi:hypothetical protein